MGGRTDMHVQLFNSGFRNIKRLRKKNLMAVRYLIV